MALWPRPRSRRRSARRLPHARCRWRQGAALCRRLRRRQPRHGLASDSHRARSSSNATASATCTATGGQRTAVVGHVSDDRRAQRVAERTWAAWSRTRSCQASWPCLARAPARWRYVRSARAGLAARQLAAPRRLHFGGYERSAAVPLCCRPRQHPGCQSLRYLVSSAAPTATFCGREGEALWGRTVRMWRDGGTSGRGAGAPGDWRAQLVDVARLDRTGEGDDSFARLETSNRFHERCAFTTGSTDA